MKKPEKVPITPAGFEFRKFLADLKYDQFKELFELEDRKYWYYDKWKFKAKEWGMDPQYLWAGVKASRYQYKKITISPDGDFNFRIETPSVVQEYLHEFDMNLGGSLQGDTIIPAEDKDRYLISSLMEEAIASSQLEGAATTRKVAKEMLETNRKPKNLSEQMILNNYEAMKWIVANKDLPLSIESIQTLQGIITKSTLAEEEAGRFRQTDDINVVDVQTGGILYAPPKSERLIKLMESFCRFANDKTELPFFLHPINKGVTLHFLLGYIHPFADGNGRTARTLFYWYLLKKGYWLIEFMSVSRIILQSKARYARAYLHTEQDDNDLTYFIIYNLDAIHLALEDLRAYIKRKTAEKQNAITLLRNTSFNERQVLLIQELIKDSTLYFNVIQVETRFGVSNQTARNDLNGLVAAGILRDKRNGKQISFLPVDGFMKKLIKGGMTFKPE